MEGSRSPSEGSVRSVLDSRGLLEVEVVIYEVQVLQEVSSGPA